MRDVTDQTVERLLLWVGSLGLAMASALGLSAFWLLPPVEPDMSRVRSAVVVAPSSASDVSDSNPPPMPIDFHRFALNGLLAPLIDDAGNWTDAALDFMCDPGTRVLVDGQRIVDARHAAARVDTRTREVAPTRAHPRR